MTNKNLPIPTNEQQRLKALKRYEILDSLTEKEFDRITELASIICNTPISLISLIDESRQWFKSKIGLDISETPRELAFCQYTIMEDTLFEVKDALLDIRFKDNELVTGNTGIRFYAGVPLSDPSGYNLGTICVIDQKPRSLTQDQKRALKLLSHEVTDLIVSRRKKEELKNFESLFELSPDLICIAGFDGSIIKVNPAMQQLLGLSLEQLMATSFYDYIHPEDLAATMQEITHLRSGKKVLNFVMRIRSASDGYRTIQWGVSPETNTNNLFAVGRDLTEESELQKNLMRTKKMLEETNQVAKIGSWQVDLEDLKIYWTSMTKQIHGMPADFEPDLQSALNFYKEGESRDEITNVVNQAMLDGGSWDLELQIVNALGQDIWVRVVGKAEMEAGVCQRIYGTFQDIDEKKKAQIAISKSGAILSAFAQHAPAAVAMLDQEMRYVAVTNCWLQDYDLKDRDVIGLSYYEVFDFLTPKEKDRHNRVLHGAVERHDEDRFTLAGSDSPRYAAWEMRPWYQLDGKIGGMMIFTQDVTSKVEQREQLKATTLQAKEASAAKSEFLANMSHEIRTPLNGVIGFTDLVLKTVLTDTQQQYLTIVNQSANALLLIINDILDFSKIEAGKLELDMEQVDLFEVCEQATDLISYHVQNKGLEMLLNLRPNLPRFIWADSVRLKQILVNLLSNAAKFTEKGEIELKIEELSETDGKSCIRFAVRDTGIGIKLEKQTKIFEAFSQEDGSTTKKYGGTGLGLTISNKLLAMMNSRLELQSTPGAGSTFFFDITMKSAKGEPIVWENLERIKEVMIVDDNDNNREIISQMLLLKNIKTIQAKNGFDALHLLTSGKRFDAILMDYHMPYMDGLETIAKIREMFYATKEEQPIILLSSSSDAESVARGSKALQVNHRLVKPVKMQDIYAAMSRLYQKTAQAAPSPLAKETSTNQNDYTILIAEDNAINMLLAVTILRRVLPNAKLLQAKNGLEALGYCLKSWPNLILMDVQMPEMNGLEATARIRAMEPDSSHIPIIAITAANVKEEKDKCLAAGMDDFVVKPIAEETLAKALEKWL